MTDHDLDALVASATPYDPATVARLPLAAGEADLREALMSHEPHPVDIPGAAAAAGTRRDGEPAAADRSRRRGRGRRVAATVVAASVVVALALSGVLRGGPGGSGTAWAAPLVRFAESTPLLLLDEPGWRVTRADEVDEDDGEMTFAAGDLEADLHWRSGPLEGWQADRAHDADLVRTYEVLGASAQVTSYSDREFTALWERDGRVLEFRTAAGGDLPGFLRLLRRLAPVDVDRWLHAMPASVVVPLQRAGAVRGMLDGVPVPPGLDLADLERERSVRDRYQLGARVTRRVTCRWAQVWQAARRAGDAAGEAAAVRAMATSREWPILREMERSGDWPSIVHGVAPAMRQDDTASLRAARARDVTPEFCGVRFPQE